MTISVIMEWKTKDTVMRIIKVEQKSTDKVFLKRNK